MIRGFFLSLTIAISILAAPVSAQVPTAEQLELLQSMSPEDRQALMEQLGLGGSVVDGGSRDDTGRGGSRSGRSMDGASNRELRDDQAFDDEGAGASKDPARP